MAAPQSMSSTAPRDMPSEAAIESLRDELEGNIFRGIKGFFTKYFEGKPWTAIAIKTTESNQVASNSCADLLGLTDFDGLAKWFAAVQSQLLNIDDDQLGFDVKLINGPDLPFKASIYLNRFNRLESQIDPQLSAGCTRVFGEYHSSNDAVVVEDSVEFLHFCERARLIFTAQPARIFLHAFLIYGTTLELWVFDRSGCYSSEKFDLSRTPDLLVQTLASYNQMSDEELGFNTFVKGLGLASDPYVTFNQEEKLYLNKMIATPNHIVGLGTTCYAASTTITGQPSIVVKFSWREDDDRAQSEVQMLKQARERNVQGIVRLVGDLDLVTIASLRNGLEFPRPFMNRTLSCVATTPLGRLLQTYSSIQELLAILCDLVRAIQSLHLDGRMLHRDIAIKNTIIPLQPSADSLKGILIDFDQALDLDTASSDQSMIGSDGYMAIGILSGKPHTYRHDLESLFYMFLWLAIGNDRVHDNIYDILEGLPKESRLWAWCSMDFYSVRQAKIADMSPEGFPHILDEFPANFASLRGLAEELHALLFPLRDGEIFTGTETSQVAIAQLYSGMADAFKRSALKI